MGSNTYNQGQLESVTDPRGYITTFTYDSFGDLASSTTVAGSNTDTTVYAHDEDGRLFCTVSPDASALGVACPSSPNARVADTQSETYDTVGNLLTSTDPDGNETQYTYDSDNDLTITTDAMGDETYNTYDPDDRLSTSTRGYGTSQASISTYLYDLLPSSCPSAPSGATFCSQTSVGSSSNTTSDFFDASNNLIESEPPSPTTVDPTSYTYDLDGNVVTKTDGAGTTNYSYNGDSLVKQISYSNTAAGYSTPNAVCYEYDQDNNRVKMLETDCGGSADATVYKYDGFERLSKVTDDFGNVVTYGYDPDTLVTCLSYPNSGSTTCSTANPTGCPSSNTTTGIVMYCYNSGDLLTAMLDWKGDKTSFSYDDDANLASETFPTTNASETGVNYSYDQSDNLVDTAVTDSDIWTTSPYRDDLTHLTLNADELIESSASSGGAPATLGYDPLTRITTELNGAVDSYNSEDELESSTLGSSTTNYGFNADSQLCDMVSGAAASCSAPPTGSTLFGYDSEGDRCFTYQGTTESYTCSSLPTSSSLQTYGWNEAGELVCSTASNSHSPSYSCANQNSAYTSLYSYNGDGMRTSDQPAGSASQDFVWNTQGSQPKLLEDGSNYYLYGPNNVTPVEQILESSGAQSYLVEDNQGVRYRIGQDGSAKGTASYTSYGIGTGGLGSPFRFAGGYTDPDGLIYLINRYYDPQSGQFLSIDPDIALTGQPYGYANEDPANSSDPSGTDVPCSSMDFLACATADDLVGAVGAEYCFGGNSNAESTQYLGVSDGPYPSIDPDEAYEQALLAADTIGERYGDSGDESGVEFDALENDPNAYRHLSSLTELPGQEGPSFEPSVKLIGERLADTYNELCPIPGPPLPGGSPILGVRGEQYQ